MIVCVTVQVYWSRPHACRPHSVCIYITSSLIHAGVGLGSWTESNGSQTLVAGIYNETPGNA